MSYESYCASCTYMNENQNYGKYYCNMQGEWRKASDPKCRNYCEAYGRSNGGRENMYYYSSRYYILTAILQIVKSLDKNYQLSVFGNFIENTLKQDEQYYPLIYAYELIGPEIANAIQEDKNKIGVAVTMFYKYIKPTIKAIEENQKELAVNIYKTMTLDLAKRYNVDTNINLPLAKDIDMSQIHLFAKKRTLIQETA